MWNWRVSETTPSRTKPVRIEVEMAGRQAYVQDVARAVEAKLGTGPVVTPNGGILWAPRSSDDNYLPSRGKLCNETGDPRLSA